MRRFGLSRTQCLTSIDTEVVLPTPVEPTMAKWRRVSSSTLTRPAIAGFCVSVPISTTSHRDGEDRAQVGGADAVGDGAERRKIADAAKEHRGAARRGSRR